jgi:hypothetical protein
MTSFMKHIRFLAMIVVCINPITVIASDYRSLPVPPLYGASAGIGFVNGGDNLRAIDKMFSFVNHKQQIIMLATGIVVLSIIYYMYKQNTVGNVKKAALEEIRSYIETIQKKMDACIDKLPGCPLVVKKYLKETLSKSFAEYTANIPKAMIRYIRKNRIYLMSVGLVPVGIACSHPVMGGAMGMAGMGYGFFKSLSEEVAAFREENKDLHKITQEKIEKLSDQIQGITDQLDQLKIDLGNKVDGMSDKLNKLSQELGTITIQMLSLHEKIDIRNQKDDQRDNQMTELLEKLEKANSQFNEAQKNFVEVVEGLIKKSDEKSAEEFKNINEAMLKIDEKNVRQGEIIENIQIKISTLLDSHEANRKKCTELLDSVNMNTLFLENVKKDLSKQSEVSQNIQKVLDAVHHKINENHKALLTSISESVKQCSDLSSRMTTLESKVERDQEYNKEMFKKLSQQNEQLKNQIEQMKEENVERDKKLFQIIENLEKNQKKEHEDLRNGLETTAANFDKQFNSVHNKLDDIISNSQPHITYMLTSSELPESIVVHPNFLSIDTLKKQQLQTELGKS